MNNEQDIMSIIAELDEVDQAPKLDEGLFKKMVNGEPVRIDRKFDLTAGTRWEDRTMGDRIMDFIQTTDSQSLASLGLVGAIFLGLLAVPFL